MRRMLLLFMVAVILVIVSAAPGVAQGEKGEFTVPVGPPEGEKDLPKSGGLAPSSVLLPAGAALLGMGLLGYAVIRRR